MESIQLTRRLSSCKLSPFVSPESSIFRPSGQLSFDHLLKRSLPNVKLTVVRSGKSGKSSVEEDKRAVRLDVDRDVSGSVIGLNLIPTSGDHEVIGTNVAVATVTKEEIKKEKAETRVTYNIVFVTAEAAPYSKTGGLGDVCGSLPIQLANHGHRVMVVSPRYLNGTSSDENFARVFDANKRIKLQCFGGEQEIAH